MTLMRCAALAAAVLVAAFCPRSELRAAEKLRVGLYVDAGSRGSGVLYWAQLLANSPQLELTLLEGADLRDGKLDGLDLLVMPGGASGAQFRSMGEQGAAAVRRFVARGGAYVGTCAGLHSAMNKPNRIGLLAFTRVDGASGAEAPLSVKFTPEGAARFGIAPGSYLVRYSHGPIIVPAAQPGEGRSEVVAAYSSSITPLGRDNRSFFGAPAAVYGEYGKGRIAVTSFHPESYASTRCIAIGMIYATTGVKPTPEIPHKDFRPLRVGYWSRAIIGRRCVAEALELDRCAELDVRFTDGMDFDAGALRHLDVLVFMGGIEARYKNDLIPRRAAAVMEFMRRGGRVVVNALSAKYIPEHPNRITLPENGNLTELLRRLAAPAR